MKRPLEPCSVAKHAPLLALLMFAVTTACSGSSSDSSTPSTSSSGFVGTWSCSGTAHLTLTEPPGAPEMTAADQVTLTITADGANVTAVRTTANNAPPCTMHWSVDGDTATFAPNQTCDDVVSNARGTGTFTTTFASGSAVLTGATLTLNHTGPLQGQVTADGGTRQIAGTATVSDTCTR